MNGFSTHYGLGTAAPRSNSAGAFAFPTNPAAPAPLAAPANPAPPARGATVPAPGATGPAALPTQTAARNAAVVANVNAAAEAVVARAALAPQPQQQPAATDSAPYVVRQYGPGDDEAKTKPSSGAAWIVFALFAVGAIVLLSRK